MAAGGVAGADYLRGVLLMSDLRKAAEQALEALEGDYRHAVRDDAIDALRAALAQPEPEPVAWMQTENFIDSAGLWDERKTFNFEGDGTPLYTAPPQRNPLTEEEIAALSEQHIFASRLTKFVRAIERAHGIGDHNV